MTDKANKPTIRTLIGWALIGSAFVLAVWATLQVGNAFNAGQRGAQLLGSWLVFTLVAWLVTRKRSLAARANARIVVGVLLWLVALVNLNADANEKKVGQAFLRDAIALNAGHTKKFLDLNERFTRVDLSTTLTPANVTTAAGITRGRAQVAQFKELIAARDALLLQNLEEVRKLVASVPAGPTKSGAQGIVSQRRDETIAVFKELSKTQLAHLTLVEQILDWCAAQGDKLANQGGQLLYESEAQAAELKILLDKLTVAETTANKAFEAASSVEQRAEERKVRSLKQATDLLK